MCIKGAFHFSFCLLLLHFNGHFPGKTGLASCLCSVRLIREFREMPITDINARTHPITDTDMKSQCGSRSTSYAVLPPTSHLPDTRLLYWNWLVAMATRLYTRTKWPSVYAATVYGSRSRGRVGRRCPQALGQTVVITSKQASGAKRAGRGRGRCTQASLSV